LIEWNKDVNWHHLFSGRTAAVRRRMHSWCNYIALESMMAIYHRCDITFSWERFNFNDSQRKALINFLIDNKVIVEYNRGWKFEKENTESLSVFVPDKHVFDSAKYTGPIDTAPILRVGEEEKQMRIQCTKTLRMAASDIRLRTNVPLFYFRRIFSGDKEHGGRVYAPFQTMKADDRRRLIKIDNEHVTEIDYPSNHLRLSLCMLSDDFSYTSSLEFDRMKNDFDMTREEMKIATIVFLNSSNPILAFTNKRGRFNWCKEKARGVCELISQTYPILNTIRRSGKLGTFLQYIEGDITIDVLRSLKELDRIALPVHDSFIIRKVDGDLTREIMRETWQNQVSLKKQRFREIFLK
jgi:hypothetical protein